MLTKKNIQFMKRYLSIDWGNSRVKAGYFKDNKLDEEFNFSHEEGGGELLDIILRLQPEATIFCSVAKHPEGLPQAIADHSKLIILNRNTKLPFMNAYQSQETLGADRLALVAGAQKHFPNQNSLVISIGTAITYNFLQNGHIFRGGNITPGLTLRLWALAEFTDGLPRVSPQGESPLLGYNTEASIRGGSVWGIAAEIEGMIKYYEAQYSCTNVVITGGDLSLFENKFKTPIFADSQILLKGLNQILNDNVK